jgi:hypothetical protein
MGMLKKKERFAKGPHKQKKGSIKFQEKYQPKIFKKHCGTKRLSAMPCLISNWLWVIPLLPPPS